MNHSRILSPADYALFEEHKEVEALVQKHPGLFRYEHEHRKWEYGLCLNFLKTLEARPHPPLPQEREKQSAPLTILEIGGGGSPLAIMLAHRGYDVTMLDPWDASADLKRQTATLGGEVRYVPEQFQSFADREGDVRQFDFVIATSVIEHVEFDHAFVDAMARLARRATFLTTDFHPDGQPFSQAHLRTYNADSLLALAETQARRGFDLSDSDTAFADYRPEHQVVYQYSFASLAMVRPRGTGDKD